MIRQKDVATRDTLLGIIKRPSWKQKIRQTVHFNILKKYDNFTNKLVAI